MLDPESLAELRILWSEFKSISGLTGLSGINALERIMVKRFTTLGYSDTKAKKTATMYSDALREIQGASN